MKLSTKTSGFFLLELLLSLLIIAILFVVSIPIYKNYITKTKVSEAMTLTGDAKMKIATYYSYYGKFPANNEKLIAVKTEGQYVSDISINHGTITSKLKKLDESLTNSSLSLVPALAKTEIPKVIQWSCGYASVSDNFALQGINQTNIPSKYLPKVCRASGGF